LNRENKENQTISRDGQQEFSNDDEKQFVKEHGRDYDNADPEENLINSKVK
jgi:hypothetical protein